MAEKFDALAAISVLPRSGDGPAIDRLEKSFGALWSALRSSKSRVVHVVGTNGKGSTAIFLERLLRARGHRTGLFTSPHYFDFGERIQMDGSPASPEILRQGWEYFREHAKPIEAFGSFEAMTVMAAFAFLQHAPDVTIIEAGIGGRFDPTRLFAGNLAILTSIDIEHSELLGSTREEIAADKIDIIGAGGTVVFGWLGAELSNHVKASVASGAKEAIDISRELPIDYAAFEREGAVQLTGTDVAYRIPAEYFIRNSLLARTAAALIEDGNGATLGHDYAELCAEFTLIGRFERLPFCSALFCDVAHTPDAVAQVIATCRKIFPTPPRFVLGMSQDKKWREMCALLATYGEAFMIFEARHKGEHPDRLAAAITANRPDASIRAFPSAQALAAALIAENSDELRPIVATGGLFSAIEFRTAITGGDPNALRFY